MSTPANVPETPRPGYFERNRITLVVSHNTNFKNWAGLLEALDQIIQQEPKLQIIDSSPNNGVLSFPYQDNQIQSLFSVKLAGVSDDTEEWFAVDTAIINLVNALNEHVDTHIAVDEDEVILQAAAPNWLLVSANHTLTHIGPGGLPIEVPPPSNWQGQFDKKDVDLLIKKCRGKRDVMVVIFDTVPPDQSSQNATGFGSAFQNFTNNAIYKSLDSKLEILRANETHIYLPPIPPYKAYYATGDNIDLSDHGTFIAGIINEFAPDVPIVLVEAINNYGVGTTHVFAECLFKLANGEFKEENEKKFVSTFLKESTESPKENKSLIINCSLTINIPPPNNDGIITLDYHDKDGNATPITLHSPDILLEPARAALRHFYRSFPVDDVQIVASAGNEGDGSVPPPACYPAAFPEVLGVGALEEGIKPAYYSNLADRPPSSGVVVWGGKSHAKQALQARAHGLPRKKWNEADADEGVLGLFVGKFANLDLTTGNVLGKTPTTTGWARWAGTSFAAGIVSGILARSAHEGCKVSINSTDSFYTHLQDDPATQRTIYDEAIISVSHGPQPSKK